MAVYRFSTLSAWQEIDFDPASDRLHFDQLQYPASGVNAWWSESEGLHVYEAASGKEVVLLGMTRFDVTTSNITFADGSRLLYGDNSLAAADDQPNTLAGTSHGDHLHGWGGADTLYGRWGGDWLEGGNGADRLEGGAGRDQLNGGDDNDTLYGDAGADTMYGGAGDDLYGVENPDDEVIEFDGGGRDRVISSVDTYTIPPWVEDLTLWGDAQVAFGNAAKNVMTGTDGGNSLYGFDGDDRLRGLGGDDVLIGGAGADTMTGGAGDDDYYVDSAADAIVEAAGDGTDRVHVSFMDYTLPGAVEDLSLFGDGAGTGNGLDNRLYGGSEYTATLRGLAGNDTLDGGAWGRDILAGGSGADEFRFTAQPHRLNADRILDFVHDVDRLVLLNGDPPEPGGFPGNHADYGAAGTLAADDPRFHAAPGATSGHDADDRLVYDTTSGKLLYDPDGSGPDGAALIFTLRGAPELAATDITIVDSLSF